MKCLSHFKGLSDQQSKIQIFNLHGYNTDKSIESFYHPEEDGTGEYLVYLFDEWLKWLKD